METILPYIKNVRNIYRVRGFNITYLIADIEFHVLRNELLKIGIRLNDIYIFQKPNKLICFSGVCPRHILCVTFQTRLRVILKSIICHATQWMDMFPSRAGIKIKTHIHF